MLPHITVLLLINVVFDKVLLWKFEVKNSLEYLTDLRSLIKVRRYFGLNDDEINRLLKTIKTKTIVFKMIIVGSIVTIFLVHTTGMGFMFFKNPPSAAYALYAVSYFTIPTMMGVIIFVHFFNLYLAYIIMTDCLAARIKSVMNQLATHRTEKKDYSNLLTVLAEVDSIFETLKYYNTTLKFLLRHVIYLFRTVICGIFVLMSLEMDVYVRALLTFPVLSGVCVTIVGVPSKSSTTVIL